jgi:predicted RNase H-like nuclease
MKVGGLDGCRGGWVGCIIQKNSETIAIEFAVYPTIADFHNRQHDLTRVLIDIPIGFRDSGAAPRKCDAEARKFLTRTRSSSIFPPPCRSALYQPDYPTANKINRDYTGKGLSKQAWNIIPKMREVDQFLCTNPSYQEIDWESHPEVCFRALGGIQTIQKYKKTTEGFTKRKKLLLSHYPEIGAAMQLFMHNTESKLYEPDDILDAAILTVSASLGDSVLKPLPAIIERDSMGLPMQIIYPAITQIAFKSA